MTLIDEYFLENKPVFSGKIREAYNYSDDQLIIRTSNKISAYDFVFEDELPEKGALLTKTAKYWFKKTAHSIDNHMIDGNELEQLVPNTHESCILVKKCKPIRIEAIVRGYISGSAYKQYLESGMIGDINIKENMQLNDKFDSPIFTPSTKAAVGDKDQNISLSEMYEIIGKDVAEYIKSKSFELYNYAHKHALEKGLTLIDTKFEFGYNKDNKIILIDEIFTPDCSRYCLTSDLKQKNVNYFDKQYYRDYLKSIKWDNDQISIPDKVKESIISRYSDVFGMLTDE